MKVSSKYSSIFPGQLEKYLSGKQNDLSATVVDVAADASADDNLVEVGNESIPYYCHGFVFGYRASVDDSCIIVFRENWASEITN